MKQCTKCDITKPRTDFTPTLKVCKPCRNKQKADYKLNHPERVKRSQLKGLLKKKFNITIEEYDHILESQNHVCKICSQTCTQNHRLSIDHDHTTGKVRGLLCNPCNVGLGRFNDNIDLLDRAIQYLKTSE